MYAMVRYHPRESMELAVLVGRELLPAHLVERNLASEYMSFGNVLLAGGIAHDRTKNFHLGADRCVAHAGRTFLVGLLGLLRVVGPLPLMRLGSLLFVLVALLLFPFNLFQPSVLADEGDLYGANVRIKLCTDDRFDHPHAVRGNLPGFDALLLKLDIFLGDLAEGVVEDRYVVLDAEANIGVLVEGPLPRRVDVGGFQGNRLVAVLVGEPDPAVPIAVLDIGPAEDDKAGLQFLRIDKEGHGGRQSVQNL